MKSYVYGMILTIQFFSILPLRKEVPITPIHLERAIRVFPAFGWILGFSYAAILYGLIQWTPFSSLAIAFIIWLITIVLTGGIHLDGWMDASDAFFSYRDRDKRLEIMKDPRTGAFGVLSVIVLLSARFLFIYEIIIRIERPSYLFIFFIPFFSRIVMGMMLALVPPAKEEGLGHLFQQSCTRSTIWSYCWYLIPAAILLWTQGLQSVMIGTGMLICSLLLFLFARKKVRTWFGGISGDTVGATTEGVEVCLWMIVWLLHYYVMG
ncbi:adenosylcobinamide-GDP ribazoletransferase [Virgibacillus phasianinus]|uniref:Adenosylcobinamide-GDP ribazoletransferase n=1 Tax=Virgibacillus phasianinus TaxID=2017483 RepID=A0A220U1G5_9BACI|nr:adenosylcobinamide-GDP ribazoletransferase [Virgibacillus phasianinus]ASK61852.1 adenosylcobinamide-GDP ribazoletransferase [Virgibacillus phasianinus]